MGTFPCVIFGPALHLLWYQVVNFAKYAIGANSYSSAPCIMGIAIVCALVSGNLKSPAKSDYLLFFITVLNQGYWIHHAMIGRGKEVNPPEL